MKRTLNKLNNRRGASISIALLLLLVCAVIGSVVLTAGVAAAGRYSELAKSDRRFYCVDSAVAARTNIIENEHPSVSLLRSDETTTVTVIGADGSRSVRSTSVITAYGADSAPAEPTVFDELAREIWIGRGAVDGDVYENGAADASFEFEREFAVIPESGGSAIDGMRADVTLSADRSGRLTVTVSSGEGDDRYTVVMTFKADCGTVLSTENRSANTTYGNDSDDDTVETSVVAQTTRKTVRFSFKRTDVN